MNRTFIIRNKEVRQAAAKAVMAITGVPLMEVSIKEYVKTRTTTLNSRYWATLTEELGKLNESISRVAQSTGHTPLEIRRIAATNLLPEQSAILFARTPESVHDILKTIHGIPTSTRLGTKAFIEFEDRMVQTVVEITGEILSMERGIS